MFIPRTEVEKIENLLSKVFNYKCCLVVYKHLPYKMRQPFQKMKRD